MMKYSLTISEQSINLFSQEKIIDSKELKTLKLIIPQSTTYNVNVALLDDINIVNITSEFYTGPQAGQDARFIVSYQNSSFPTTQSIDCFGNLFLNFYDTPTLLTIENTDTVESILVKLIISSE